MPDQNQSDPNNLNGTMPSVPSVPPVTTPPVVDPTPVNTSPVQQPTTPVSPFLPQEDVPSIPDFQATITEIPASVVPPVQQSTDNGSAAPVVDTPAESFIPVVSSPKKRFGGGKVIATILGLFLLVGGVGAGIVLTQQQQNLQPKAVADGQCMCEDSGGLNTSGGDCQDNGSCTCPAGFPHVRNNKCHGAPSPTSAGTAGCVFDNYKNVQVCTRVNGVWKRCDTDPVGEMGENKACTGDWKADGTLDGDTSGGCSKSYPNCAVNSDPVTGAKSHYCLGLGSCTPQGVTTPANCTAGTGCVSSSSPTPTPTATPGPTAQCVNIKAYNTSWVLLTAAQLSALTPGTHVNFCVTGTTTGGTFDRARFTINGVLQAETTTHRPTTQDYCQNYAIPAAVTSFDIKAQLHHTILGWI